MQLAMIQNKIMPLDQVESVYLDRGIFFGDGVYEVLRSYEGKIFAMKDHLERFANSLTAIEINNVKIEDIHKTVLEVFKKADIKNAKIYFHIKHVILNKRVLRSRTNAVKDPVENAEA